MTDGKGRKGMSTSPQAKQPNPLAGGVSNEADTLRGLRTDSKEPIPPKCRQKPM